MLVHGVQLCILSRPAPVTQAAPCVRDRTRPLGVSDSPARLRHQTYNTHLHHHTARCILPCQPHAPTQARQKTQAISIQHKKTTQLHPSSQPALLSQSGPPNHHNHNNPTSRPAKMATTTTTTANPPSSPPFPLRLILVQSRIRPSPPAPSLSPATFHEWYNTVHIPDLLQTPGVHSAIRYAAVTSPSSPDTNDGSFPFIALYPSISLAWLTSPTCEFLRVPLYHPMLPGPSHFVFDVADFVIGAYVVRGAVGEWPGGGVAGAVVVEVVGEEEVREKGVEGVLEARKGAYGGRAAVLEWDFSPAGAGVRTEEVEGGRLVVGGRLLVLVSFDLCFVFCWAFGGGSCADICFSINWRRFRMIWMGSCIWEGGRRSSGC